jgi:hypothetical protein
MIQDVEEVSAESQPDSLCDSELLCQTGVEVDEPWTIERVPTRVTDLSCVRRRKAALIEEVQSAAFI